MVLQANVALSRAIFWNPIELVLSAVGPPSGLRKVVQVHTGDHAAVELDEYEVAVADDLNVIPLSEGLERIGLGFDEIVYGGCVRVAGGGAVEDLDLEAVPADVASGRGDKRPGGDCLRIRNDRNGRHSTL